MNRNIRRIRRTIDPYIPLNIECNRALDNESSIIRHPFVNMIRPCCRPTIGQRVVCLEEEVGNINMTLAGQTCELNNHEKRLDILEQCTICPEPCPPPCPPKRPCSPGSPDCSDSDSCCSSRSSSPDYACFTQQDCFSTELNYSDGIVNAAGTDQPIIDSGIGNFNQCSVPYNINENLNNACKDPCINSCIIECPKLNDCFEKQINFKPPIVFEGYSVCFKQTVLNDNLASFWFLIPEKTLNQEVYRFSWNACMSVYIYEPVNPNNLVVVFPPSATDGTHITYTYEFIPGFGLGLRPLLFLGPSSCPHIILGYQYILVNFTDNNTQGWAYVPICNNNQICNQINQCITCPNSKNLTFIYTQTSQLVNGITYYNTVDPSAINPSINVTKYPINIISDDPSICIKEDIMPMGSGVAFMLPFDTNTYQISISAELKINTEIGIVTPLGSINYLSGSGIPAAQPAVAQIVITQLSNMGIIVDTNPTSSLNLTWNNICTDPLLQSPPPNNFQVFQEPNIIGQPGAYYKTCTSNTATIDTIPILDTNNKPLSRRLVTILVTQGFSFRVVKAVITTK